MIESRDSKTASVGLGLRFEMLDRLLEIFGAGEMPPGVDFFEVSPENFMRRGGYLARVVDAVEERYPILSHGLTMSFGGVDPIDRGYLEELRRFLRRVGAPFHSDHLCFSGGEGAVFHDLFPVPLFHETVRNTSRRLKEVSSILEVPVAIENISYYLTPGEPELSEAELITSIVEESGAGLLLDVNNVYVNATNHGFDAREFIAALPLEKVVQIHVAGHEWRPQHDLIIDTHGADLIDPVYELLGFAIERIGSVPVLLERDHNLPPLEVLTSELQRIRSTCDAALARRKP
jgi:uncharacterized protein (UPF0276 family)